MAKHTIGHYKTPMPWSERTKRAIIYVRVSPSDDDREEHRSSRAQRDACYATANQLDAVIADVYETRGRATTERSATRPGYQDMLDHVRESRADYVIVAAPDRVARSMRAWTEVEAELKRSGVELIVASLVPAT